MASAIGVAVVTARKAARTVAESFIVVGDGDLSLVNRV